MHYSTFCRHQIHPNEKTIRCPSPSISRLAGEASSLLCGEALEGSSAFELGMEWKWHKGFHLDFGISHEFVGHFQQSYSNCHVPKLSRSRNVAPPTTSRPLQKDFATVLPTSSALHMTSHFSLLHCNLM